MASPASTPSPSREHTVVDTFNKWAQAIGIIVAAAWGAYTFIYKEITLPKSAPINITMTMQLKRVGAAKSKNRLVAVEMRVTASNPSSRKVYLLPSMWSVEGLGVVPKHAESPASFYERTAALMNAQGGQYETRHAGIKMSGVVAAGSLFSDSWLNPNETVTRTIIVYIPRDEYDSLFARTVIPSVEAASGIELQWKADQEGGAPEETLYLVNARGEKEPVQKSEKGGFLQDQRVRELGFQEATSSAEMSLWD
jgi:hypothetical protein